MVDRASRVSCFPCEHVGCDDWLHLMICNETTLQFSRGTVFADRVVVSWTVIRTQPDTEVLDSVGTCHR